MFLINARSRTPTRREQPTKKPLLILMSMKLHIVAASDILDKGLDLSFPYNQLGDDGLLVMPSPDEKVLPAIVISGDDVAVVAPDEAPAPISVQESEVAAPEEEETEEESIPAVLDAPVIEEEKKVGKKTKKTIVLV